VCNKEKGFADRDGEDGRELRRLQIAGGEVQRAAERVHPVEGERPALGPLYAYGRM
jgi:hypothetical protein